MIMKKKSLFGFVLLLMLMMLSAQTVFAGFDVGMSIKMPKKYATAEPYTVMFRFKGKITSVKSSKKSVASISKYKKKYLFVTPKKKGTTKITVKAGGKKYTCRFTNAKYENPFKSFKVDNSERASSFNDQYSGPLLWLTPNEPTPISIKLKSGYKLKKMTYNGKTVRNGGSITAKEDASDSYLRIEIRNTKIGQDINLTCSVEAFDDDDYDDYDDDDYDYDY